MFRIYIFYFHKIVQCMSCRSMRRGTQKLKKESKKFTSIKKLKHFFVMLYDNPVGSRYCSRDGFEGVMFFFILRTDIIFAFVILRICNAEHISV